MFKEQLGNFPKNIVKKIDWLKNKENLILFLSIILTISIFKLAFFGVSINGEIYVSGSVDSNTRVEGSVSLDN